MTSQFLWDVFLSHSSRDKPQVQQLAEHLRDAGLQVWFDQWVVKPGDDIYAAIEHGLEYSRVLILCLSQVALDSDWVKLERNTAIFRDPQNKERRFIPLLLEDCKMPSVLRRLLYVDWRGRSEEVLTDLIQSCRPPQPKGKAKASRKAQFIAPPTGTMRFDSPLYIQREADAYTQIAAQQVAETIVIKAPRQMGKSSLLISYLAACRQADKQTVMLDLASLATDEELADYPSFLTLLAQAMWEQLGQPAKAAPPRLKHQRAMVQYLASSLLPALDNPVVIAFDEIERVLGRPYQSDFFSMLRSWHNLRADQSSGFAELGLALVISTEPYLFIKDGLRSPFNVGLNIALRHFNEAECRKLNRHYHARLTQVELERLMQLLNGHPHLTHLALHALTGPHAMDFATLWVKAAERDGPFGTHLRALESRLMDDAGRKLSAAMRQIIKDGKAPARDDFYRLLGAGLVREDGERMIPANQLYQRFFARL